MKRSVEKDKDWRSHILYFGIYVTYLNRIYRQFISKQLLADYHSICSIYKMPCLCPTCFDKLEMPEITYYQSIFDIR